MSNSRADYGIDAPGVVRNLALFGFGGLAMVVVGEVVVKGSAGISIAITGAIAALIGFVEAIWMVYGSRSGKYRLREKLLDKAHLVETDEVLDVGCGRGLVVNAAARRLTTGHATGLDIWNTVDQSGNDPEVTRQNAKLEGVEDRLIVQDGDMRKMPFDDETFDAVVSSIAIHNVPDADGRAQAIREIDRVLKPGGRIALLDFIRVREHASTLRGLGWTDVTVSGLYFEVFPPVRIVYGTKPAGLR